MSKTIPPDVFADEMRKVRDRLPWIKTQELHPEDVTAEKMDLSDVTAEQLISVKSVHHQMEALLLLLLESLGYEEAVGVYRATWEGGPQGIGI